MKTFKGTLALDIDGTLTTGQAPIDPQLLHFLENLVSKGWQLFFITGRTFSFAYPLIKPLKTNYFFAVQNGASLWEMPEQKLKEKYPLYWSQLPQILPLFQEFKTGLLLEMGKEQGDICLFNPEDFNPELREYLSFRQQLSKADWQPIHSFLDLPYQECAVGKFFADEKTARMLAAQIATVSQNTIRVTVIRDPFRPGYFLAHLNHTEATKGRILTHVHQEGTPLIAAGDDENDLEMLQKANVKIAMDDAPASLKKDADYVIPQKRLHDLLQKVIEEIEMNKNFEKEIELCISKFRGLRGYVFNSTREISDTLKLYEGHVKELRKKQSSDRDILKKLEVLEMERIATIKALNSSFGTSFKIDELNCD